MNEPTVKDRYKYDLSFGKDGELFIKMLNSSSDEWVEVKRDRRWVDTGNMFFEFEDHDGVPTGLAKTEAKFYIYLFNNTGVMGAHILRVDLLKHWLPILLNQRRIKTGKGGDTGKSTGYLLPITMSQLVMRPIEQ